ncbi:MAG TPA: DMT family transporter [Anaerolineae bacterium]|nr:DMT family transporter [Anaerolineae bacterium]
MTRREASLFLILSAIWGSSFLFIKLGLLGGMGPLTMVMIRLALGSVSMGLLAWKLGESIPRSGRILAIIFLVALVNNTLPFSLITWGEQFIPSGLTAILNSTTPLFAVIIAHVALADERFTWSRVVGVIVGFMGVVTLFVPDLISQGMGGAVIGQLAVILGSLGYASGSVIARKYLHHVPSATLSALQLAIALLWILIPTLWLEKPWTQSPTLLAWFSAAWLGLLGTGLAYLIFYRLLKSIGATPATMVTYVIPIFAVIFGVIFLNEQLYWMQLVALALIFVGVWLVNRR